MKNTSIVIILVFMFVGCEKAIQITQPIILIENEYPKVFDTIQFEGVEYAEIDGERQTPNYFSWSILDQNQQVIYSEFKNSSTITWIPDRAGYFIISAKIGYDNNKSITTLKEIEVHESTLSLQKRLIGKWTGNAESFWGARWQVDLQFDEVGHYIGKGYNLEYKNGDYPIMGPFQGGYYSFSNSAGGSIDLKAPSENVPCTKFLLNKILDSKGYGVLSASYEYEHQGKPYYYECTEIYTIEELTFSNNDKGLFFSLNSKYDIRNDWEIKYNLIKIK